MRTNIVLDDHLVKEAMQVTGIRTKKDVVHKALELLLKTEHEAASKARYESDCITIQSRTSRLVLRERPHDSVRSDRDFR